MTNSSRKQIEVENLVSNKGLLDGYMRQLEEMVEMEPDKKMAAIWFFSQLKDDHGLSIFKIIQESRVSAGRWTAR